MIRPPSKSDPFHAILGGDYRSAIEAYDVQERQRPSSPIYVNRGLAYLNLGLLDAALRDFQAAEEMDRGQPYRQDGVLRLIGMVWWLKHERDRAVALWHEGVRGILSGEITMSDAAGGVLTAALVWYASPAESDPLRDAVRLLRKRAKKTIWPGPVSAFLLGLLDRQAFLAAARTPVAALSARQICQAFFYAGARARREGHNEDARDCFRESTSQQRSAIVEAEYYLAKAEELGSGSTPESQR